ncbi:3,4-dihydroxy-2-butanone 4-phosphate synthase [Candidatus Bilamarchaeum dharawalense]|uniref:3,4-dihydroxy-2-butanone 4-phosphate synthase n=1 Tax=Candidatus Bilamarchaeum dharawalense TaxID=2885759 RepID=A0A5E4LTA7_9ARCH|nr:3,4-dihydroxy-2-butanone 4-phosphate synthase [Candidatus Bilamarchaeum dharawalense]
MTIQKAMTELRKGNFVLVYDGDDREGEADLIMAAKFITPEKIETMRKDGGGLICAAINKQKADEIGLPFFTDLVESGNSNLVKMSCRKTAYGDKPAFSIPINHNGVYTGITDKDRALTLTRLNEVITKKIKSFTKEFYTPGHIFLLIGRGLKNRRGHTELALELGKQANFEVMVLCEMLGKKNALSKNDAKKYAKNHGLVFIEGKEIG